jgi:uncharacterized protein (DUF952 family)
VPAAYERDGFVHLSRPEQAHVPANLFYAGERDLVLLWIDPERLRAELRHESTDPAAGGEPFPHLYGPLNLEAVVAVTELEPWEPGGFVLPPPPG